MEERQRSNGLREHVFMLSVGKEEDETSNPQRTAHSVTSALTLSLIWFQSWSMKRKKTSVPGVNECY